MDFSLSSLLAGFIFGVFGFYFLKQGKMDGNAKRMLLGIALMAYSYFISNPWLNWGAGTVLFLLALRS